MKVKSDMISDNTSTSTTTTTTIAITTTSQITIESSQSELKKLTKDKLLKICKKNKIEASKSFRKDELIQSILDFHCQNDALNTTPKSNHSMNEFHRGFVEYSLPTTTIIEILRICWKLRLQSTDIMTRYREALQLTCINKQFHAIVGSWLTRIKNIDKQSLERAITNPMNPITNIDSIVFFDCELIPFTNKRISPLQSRICESIQKLVSSNPQMNKTPFNKTFQITLKLFKNLRSIDLQYHHLSGDDLLQLATVPTLINIKASNIPLSRENQISFYRVIDHPFRKIIFDSIHPFDLYSSMRPEFHCSLKTIGRVANEFDQVWFSRNTPITTSIASLRKIQTDFFFRQPELLIKIFDVEHLAITHLTLSLVSSWIPIILKLRCLETLEDINKHKAFCQTATPDEEQPQVSKRGFHISGYKTIICLPTLEKLIFYFNSNSEQYMIYEINRTFTPFTFSHKTLVANTKTDPNYENHRFHFKKNIKITINNNS
ncbi:hypothetical protein PPL_05429 [Heterostelium album PN500]|uniref:Rho termination factor-like N-terminal domain-containing protein n=1 Tax=Heterostelium pallidum (strain ATCC 26659 / Pp 5 / PN500) TaxID=670386 RepID=D3BA54_HETP5|nr:hypothetical protein PPL_05429 [Heterostelium album PN500]EFA81441.1 hypothetical protein PPL_05429 [Heterostelium album PN500]|eukprot:XP_020433559.1 hypothetical protein PPL_05429 [Heterostelium album PN500]